jgi:hypothetical protein
MHDVEVTVRRTASLLGLWSLAIVLPFLILIFCGVDTDARVELQKNAVSHTATSAFESSATSPFTHQVYVPLIVRTFLPLTETLKTRYLFVEHWRHIESSEDCPWPTLTSIPVYSFHRDSEVLIVYPPDPELRLQADDIGYIGEGASSGYLFANFLYRVQQTPFSVGEMTLNDVDDAGSISLEYAGRAIALAPTESWIFTTISQTTDITTCVVTTTDRISNYAFQRRDKIEYYNE